MNNWCYYAAGYKFDTLADARAGVLRYGGGKEVEIWRGDRNDPEGKSTLIERVRVSRKTGKLLVERAR